MHCCSWLSVNIFLRVGPFLSVCGGTLLIGSPPVPFPHSLLTVYQQEGACFLLVYERLMVGLPGFACPAMGVVSISRGTACQQLKLLNVSSTLPLFCEQLLTKNIHVHVFNLFNLLLHMYSLNPRCAKGQSDQPWTFCCLVLFLKWYVTQQGNLPNGIIWTLTSIFD